MSMGYLVPNKPDTAIVWRGLMVQKAVQQLLFDVDWGGLDILVLDMPPGTGDVQLTLGQLVNVDGYYHPRFLYIFAHVSQALSLCQLLKT